MAEREPNVAGKLPIPRVAAPAQQTRRGRRKKSKDEKQAQKKELDRARNKTRINIGAAFLRWRELLYLKRFKSDAELATFLLDKCEVGALTSSATTSHRTALSCSVRSSSSDCISSLDTHDDINESDFNHIQNCVIDWAGDWTRAPQDDTGDVSASEEENSMGEGSYHDDTDDEEEEEEDYMPPLCVRAAGAGEQKLPLDALPAVGMEDTVHDTLVTESAESQPVQSEDDITNHPAAITYHVCLMQLARYLLLPIPVCTAKDPVTLAECQATGPFQVQIKSRGTAVIMQWMCPNNHCVWEWNSQPTFKDGMQAGDFLLASNIILSGNYYAKVALLFKFMKLGIVDWSTFLKIQDTYCVGTIKDFWDSSRADVVSRLKSKENVVVLAGGHMGSPGSSAQFCTYTIMENETKEILSIVNIDKGETQRSCVTMEREGFIRSFEQIHQEVKLTEVCTDSQSQISALFDPVKGKYKDSGVLHTLDMWHGSKNLAKKMHAAGQQKGCSILLQWIKDICNYFWFCCKMTENFDNFYDMWAGLLNHVTGEHEWPLDAGQRPSGERRDKAWIENGSVAHRALSEVILNQRWLKEVHKYLHFRSTAELESFHNHILMYASKRFSFSRPVYEARIFLAGLDYNHHVHRPPRRKPDGSVQYRKLYNKKSRKWCLYAIKEEKDYRYIPQLQRAIVGKRVASGRGLPRLTAATQSDPRQYGVLFVAPASSTQQPLKSQASRGQNVPQIVVALEEDVEELSPAVDQQKPEALRIKEEPDDESQFSQLHQNQTEGRCLPASSSDDKMETDEEESSRNPDLHSPQDTREEQIPGVDHQDLKLLHIKQEEEEPWTGLEGEHLSEKQTDPFPLNVVLVKSEHEEKPLFSHLHQPGDGDLPTSSSADLMKAEDEEEDGGAAESSRNPDLHTDGDTSCSSETEVSEDEEEDDGDSDSEFDDNGGDDSDDVGGESDEASHPDSQHQRMSDSGSGTEDSEADWKEGRESGGNAVSSLSCSECGKRFVNERSLQRHRTHHSTGRSSRRAAKSTKGKKNANTLSPGKVQSDVKLFTCDDCGKSFSWKNHLSRHKRIHTGEKPFGCDVCGQRFNQNSNLNKHMRIHTGGKPFGCDVCGQRFNLKSYLHIHMRIHTGEKPFGCDVCGQRFNQKSNLNKHAKIHSGGKPFGCDFCGQRFNLKSYLSKHVRVHTGEKPYRCGVCDQRFNLKSHLNLHKLTHTGEKPFACDICGQRLIQKSALKKHMKIHCEVKSFDCDVCGRRFNQKSALKRHLRIHTGDKPFGCDVCGQRFNQKAHLNKHMTLHTGAKLFGCDVCGLRFNLKSHLIKHSNVHRDGQSVQI
ncbi:uncharacterized protein LOC103130530 [Poecilia formosa]|uniref:uncharacterized protein LOC103130530 n=1 Tax=Poecilia formosa TaxID=48698 RepID=UPI0007B87AF6|nr:PREDICTED: uncharacterized protein LOC103130530 [Poecilia formosa]